MSGDRRVIDVRREQRATRRRILAVLVQRRAQARVPFVQASTARTTRMPTDSGVTST